MWAAEFARVRQARNLELGRTREFADRGFPNSAELPSSHNVEVLQFFRAVVVKNFFLLYRGEFRTLARGITFLSLWPEV